MSAKPSRIDGARGWKPYPAYKDSGVEWLGKVPEHWEIIRLKHLAGNDINVVQTGPFGAQLHASDYVDNGVPLILIRNVNNLKIDDSDIPKISEKKAESLSSYRLEIDDIVFSRVGSIGRIALVIG
jgi:type I restriction enzyme S subunit